MKKFTRLFGSVAALSFIFSLVGPVPVRAAAAPDLGSADSFAVLAGSAVNVTVPSDITGDVGLSPAAWDPVPELTCAEVDGTIYSVDASGPVPCTVTDPVLLNSAQIALTAAYNTAAAEPTTSTIGTELDGANLGAGVYDSAAGTFEIAPGGTLTLNGDANDVFIFKMTTSLVTFAGSQVLLSGGVQACNVFWQVGSSATLGTSTEFAGNIMADQSITDDGGSTIAGRLMARIAAVTLNDTTVVASDCAPTQPASTGSGQGSMNVVKVVVNDNGGTGVISDFNLFVSDTPVVSGVTTTFAANSTEYTVRETNSAGYTTTFSGDCNASGVFNMEEDEVNFCVVTNNDIGAAAVVPLVPPLIDVVKIPSPLALPDGPGSVLYTYILRNIGTVPVTDVTMVGDTCSPIVLDSGDVDGDSQLDLTETWTYRCTTTLTETHTNIVTATGWANGLSASDIASATVIVGLPIVPPLIHVTKVPSPLALGAGGGNVTYTERITNPGTVSLSNVTLTDDKCSPMTYISGDTNDDDLLDVSETWTYTCTHRLTATTTNTAIASGTANGITVRDIAIATVVVAAAAPALPATGFSSMNPAVMYGLIAAGLLASAALAFILRKKSVV